VTRGDLNVDEPLRRQALGRIAKLYEAWDAVQPGQGYAAKAADWRGKLEDLSYEATKPRSNEGPTATQPAGAPAAAAQPASSPLP